MVPGCAVGDRKIQMLPCDEVAYAGSASATATLIVWIILFKFDPIAILVEDLYFRYFESAVGG